MSWGIALFSDKPIIYKLRLQRNIPRHIKTIGNYATYEEAVKQFQLINAPYLLRRSKQEQHEIQN